MRLIHRYGLLSTVGEGSENLKSQNTLRVPHCLYSSKREGDHPRAFQSISNNAEPGHTALATGIDYSFLITNCEISCNIS